MQTIQVHINEIINNNNDNDNKYTFTKSKQLLKINNSTMFHEMINNHFHKDINGSYVKINIKNNSRYEITRYDTFPQYDEVLHLQYKKFDELNYLKIIDGDNQNDIVVLKNNVNYWFIRNLKDNTLKPRTFIKSPSGYMLNFLYETYNVAILILKHIKLHNEDFKYVKYGDCNKYNIDPNNLSPSLKKIKSKNTTEAIIEFPLPQNFENDYYYEPKEKYEEFENILVCKQSGRIFQYVEKDNVLKSKNIQKSGQIKFFNLNNKKIKTFTTSIKQIYEALLTKQDVERLKLNNYYDFQ